MAIRDMMPFRGGAPGAFDAMKGFVESMEKLFEWAPSFGLEDTGDAFVLSATLPGLEKDDVELDVTDESVILRAARVKKGKGGGRSTRQFYQSVSLPSAVRADQAKASFKDGKLEVRLPKIKESRVRRVEIQ